MMLISSMVWIEIQQMVQLYQSRMKGLIANQSAVSLQTEQWKTAL